MTKFHPAVSSILLLFLPALPVYGEGPVPAGTAPVPAETKPIFGSTPSIPLTDSHDFTDLQKLRDDAAQQLKGLCSLSEFRTLPEPNRYVYAFSPWPAGAKDELEDSSYCFNFHLDAKGGLSQKVAFIPTGGGPGKKNLLRSRDPSSSQYLLGGFGNLNWGGKSEHLFRFDKPVTAFGVVLRSSGDVDLRRFFWASAKDKNGYPISYTLSDGSVVQLGQRELSGLVIKGGTDTFLGVIDRSGTGIASVCYMLKGLAGNTGQSISVCSIAFVTKPKPTVAPVISLKGRCDFYSPETIAPAPAPAVPGLATLEAFRFIVGDHRYVYDFETWPQKEAGFQSNSAEFSFDLRGKGAVGQKLTVTAENTAKNAKLTQTRLKNNEALPYCALGGLGDLRKGAWAEQTFKFEKPVWAFGVTYRSPGNLSLGRTGEPSKSSPVTYTLSDGTVVTVGGPGAPGGTVAANEKTFVGLIDDSGKGISSVTLRVEGTASVTQPLYIEDVAFALSGPPPGDWKMTLNEDFNGDTLDPNIWTPGYTFPDVINAEKQGYVPENISVANGVCTIKVEQRDCVNTDRYGRKGAAQKFASGAFTSFDKFTQTYGYFEARVKMPKARGAGIWPAFWSLPDRGKEYPDRLRRTNRTKEYGRGSEIDIFEFMPWWKREDGRFPIHMGCIWNYGKVTEQDPEPHGYGSYALDNNGWGPDEIYFPDLDTKFHTYGLYWSPERLIFYVDSKPVFRVKDTNNIPDVPQYFLFNVAISGNGWGKSPDRKHPTHQQIIDDMPNQMEIDYFRAYSGILDEPIPPSPTDLPSIIRTYTPPPKGVDAMPSPPPAAASPTPATDVPAAPVNSEISSPAGG